MKYGIISDIHGNLEALDAVLTELSREKVDKVICLGDIVGYGANPQECYEVVKDIAHICVAGNHDMAATGKIQTDNFNLFARIAVMWTKNQLNEEALAFLRNLELLKIVDNFQVVHANLFNPGQFEYIQTSNDAINSFANQIKKICFVGHSHIPVVLIKREDTITFSLESEFDISSNENEKLLINVGSVGQPRDENPDAAYAIYDSQLQKVRINRVEYNVRKAIAKINNAKLPEILGERLRYGR